MDFEFPRGDTKKFKFQIKDVDGNILTLSGTDQLYFTVKDNSRTSSVLMQKKIGSGITYNPEDQYYYVTIDPTDTNSLDYRSYGYDIELKSTNLVKTLVTGEITLTEEYTFSSNE